MHLKPYIFGISLWVISGCNSAQINPQQDISAPPNPQTTSASHCQDTEYRQMDFWVGTWDLSWTNADGTQATGTNIISRSPYGACIITENFDGNPGLAFKGMSLSTYSKPHKQWRQTWVDDQGGYIALYGGLQADGTFKLEMDRLEDTGPYNRMIFEKITGNSLIWRWQGKAQADKPWTDQWVINYRRRS